MSQTDTKSYQRVIKYCKDMERKIRLQELDLYRPAIRHLPIDEDREFLGQVHSLRLQRELYEKACKLLDTDIKCSADDLIRIRPYFAAKIVENCIMSNFYHERENGPLKDVLDTANRIRALDEEAKLCSMILNVCDIRIRDLADCGMFKPDRHEIPGGEQP